MSDDDKVVNFREAAPSARLKQFDDGDRKRSCRHKGIAVWPKEPIIECTACGAVVDPYYWIRERVSDWKQVTESIEWRVTQAKAEMEELKSALRVLRKEYANEHEKNMVENRLMIMPPRRRI